MRPSPRVDGRSPSTGHDDRSGALGAPDAVPILTLVAVLLVVVPSDLRVPALGGAGAPSTLAGLACLVAWGVRAVTGRLDPRTVAVRLAVLGLAAAVLASWTAAMLRPTPPLEASAADLGLVRTAAFCGLLLLAADHAPRPERLLLLQRRIVLLGAGLALLGLVQFATGHTLVDRIVVPGLASAQQFSGVGERGGFVRAAGTAMSSLEYSYTLALVLPAAVTLACFDTARSPLRRALPAVLLVAALLTSVSRSGVVGVVVGCAVLALAWPAQVRRSMALLAPAGAVLLYVAVPGMAGTIRYLFLSTSVDPSTQSRTGSWDVAAHFVHVSPLVGRGVGTFLPSYRILDNQYLLLAVETGLLGLTAFVVVLGTCAALTRRTRPPGGADGADGADGGPELDRQLRQAALAAVVVGAVLAAVLDVMAFPMAAGTLALVGGSAAAQGVVRR